MATIAFRNHNPGNIVKGPSWAGLLRPDLMSPDQQAQIKFAVFESPVMGFRALGILLLNYQRIHGLKTIAQIITRFAPSSENNTQAYIAHVSAQVGVDRSDVIDLSIPTSLACIAKAIAIHESGGWYFEDRDLAEGIALAEHEPHAGGMA